MSPYELFSCCMLLRCLRLRTLGCANVSFLLWIHGDPDQASLSSVLIGHAYCHGHAAVKITLNRNKDKRETEMFTVNCNQAGLNHTQYVNPSVYYQPKYKNMMNDVRQHVAVIHEVNFSINLENSFKYTGASEKSIRTSTS